jgi:monoamine oxidase
MADSIIIIGAGLAGLSTGCYAQMNGYQSYIFEHHDRPGGVELPCGNAKATSSTVEFTGLWATNLVRQFMKYTAS